MEFSINHTSHYKAVLLIKELTAQREEVSCTTLWAHMLFSTIPSHTRICLLQNHASVAPIACMVSKSNAPWERKSSVYRYWPRMIIMSYQHAWDAKMLAFYGTPGSRPQANKAKWFCVWVTQTDNVMAQMTLETSLWPMLSPLAWIKGYSFW